VYDSLPPTDCWLPAMVSCPNNFTIKVFIGLKLQISDLIDMTRITHCVIVRLRRREVVGYRMGNHKKRVLNIIQITMGNKVQRMDILSDEMFKFQPRSGLGESNR